jgi:hypothetical protein
MAIIKAPSSSKKTKKRLKVTAKRDSSLDADWEKLLAAHSRPLEKGAKSKGVRLRAKVASSQSLIPPLPPETTFNLDKMVGSTAKPTSRVYTGTAVVGIATLHKSNAVPVFSQEEALDVAKMRRN